MELGRIVQGINNERQTFDLEQNADELDNTIRALKPVVQIIMETVAPSLSKYESPEAQRHRPTSGTPQEQEQNRSTHCSGTYPNYYQLPPTGPSWAGDSLFPQVSGLCK
jgi:hypothetical protein